MFNYQIQILFSSYLLCSSGACGYLPSLNVVTSLNNDCIVSSTERNSCSNKSTLCLASSGCNLSSRLASSSILPSKSSSLESDLFISLCTFSAKRCNLSNLQMIVNNNNNVNNQIRFAQSNNIWYVRPLSIVISVRNRNITFWFHPVQLGPSPGELT